MSHRILLVVDHQMFREGLKAVLKSETDFQVVGEAGNGIQAVELSRELAPDVVIMDISMPEMSGIEAAGKIHAESPGIKIIILSKHTEKSYILGALKAGATGIVAKNSASAELVTAIQSVVNGKNFLCPFVSDILVKNFLKSGVETGEKMLSPRERQILQMISMGKGTKDIGFELDISNKTVETHRVQLTNKLGIRNVADLVKYAIREGIVELE